MVDHTHQDIDAATGTATTGHEWDGIKELNTPLPKWWLYVLYATMVWAVGYWFLYPAIPLPGGATPGILGWSSRGAVTIDLKELQAQRAPMVAQLNKDSLQQIAADPKLAQFARAYGHSAFGVNCAPCHGSNGQGSKGYPNLTADRWLWGGTLDEISATITHGARYGDPDGHQGDMPAWGASGILNKQQIDDVANYVYSLSHKTTADVSAGKKVFMDNCTPCHGENAKGNIQMGAPNLTTKIWLYGGDKADLIQTITNGRGGHMPAWGSKLDPATIKALTVYVHSLGGGQ
ncbi:cytochrome-c oxidase, cbb3-type subunit III [Rhodoblastus acidophilus]|uniref:Cbb3-type cytochrome c oxidase subunit n=1 Tax=Candidatus Rhodoblastus alkanivorans TaxID=2954117 RepID=A0ABS9ZAG2_9HYPH|nr:cytochrome-c oxidase, cbb3-type subunit III [Candidatus Rhodoblastus alkanivorans]MCI4677818.1 cytochrome-c oxidase, cbb3-type subunit III [Candidatus Rhodoblastus alkanivorans]MCI4684684.1 cytochrome-c oxidase, cbb3-type subunit III [Candidatus Rhodoblastus alkanivorans]MDI4642006.1 cytochrome-c oxidase, cbb3-type subunit III [Rhodoblastus acidophilus]